MNTPTDTQTCLYASSCYIQNTEYVRFKCMHTSNFTNNPSLSHLYEYLMRLDFRSPLPLWNNSNATRGHGNHFIPERRCQKLTARTLALVFHHHQYQYQTSVYHFRTISKKRGTYLTCAPAEGHNHLKVTFGHLK